MTAISYSWNPFQDITSCDIKNELITSQGGQRAIIIPRAAPFFSDRLVLRNAVTNNPLVFGVDYVFCLPFEDFIKSKSKLVYGGIVLTGQTGIMQLSIDYSTIGAPFVLDDNAYASALGNIANASRSADWRDITNLPIDGFPPDPHTHPLSQTLNYADMITVMKSLIGALNNETNNPTVQTQLRDHSSQSLAQAHGGGSPKDVGLNNVPNYGMANNDDLQGNSNERIMSVGVTRQLVQLMLKQAMADYDPEDLPITQLKNSLADQISDALTAYSKAKADQISDALTAYSKANPIFNPVVTGFDSNTNVGTNTSTFTPNTTVSTIQLSNDLYMMFGEGSVTTAATPVPSNLNQANTAYLYEGTAQITFPKAFKNRPFVFASPYDAYGASGEFAFPALGDNTSVNIRAGCNLANLFVPFAWVAFGRISN